MQDYLKLLRTQLVHKSHPVADHEYEGRWVRGFAIIDSSAKQSSKQTDRPGAEPSKRQLRTERSILRKTITHRKLRMVLKKKSTLSLIND
jgi:hypothetical protein